MIDNLSRSRYLGRHATLLPNNDLNNGWEEDYMTERLPVRAAILPFPNICTEGAAPKEGLTLTNIQDGHS